MPFIPIAGGAEVVLTCKNISTGNIMKNVFGVKNRLAPTWGTTELNTLLGVVNAWWTATVKPLVSNEIALINTLARDLHVEDSFFVENVVNVPGTLVSPAMPANVTLAVKFLTGLAGRSNRGRQYWIGLAESQVAGDFVLPTPGAAIAAAYNTLKTNLTAGTNGDLAVLSRYHNGAPRTIGVATLVTAIGTTDLRVDTQRRRLN